MRLPALLCLVPSIIFLDIWYLGTKVILEQIFYGHFLFVSLGGFNIICKKVLLVFTFSLFHTSSLACTLCIATSPAHSGYVTFLKNTLPISLQLLMNALLDHGLAGHPIRYYQQSCLTSKIQQEDKVISKHMK